MIPATSSYLAPTASINYFDGTALILMGIPSVPAQGLLLHDCDCVISNCKTVVSHRISDIDCVKRKSCHGMPSHANHVMSCHVLSYFLQEELLRSALKRATRPSARRRLQLR
jgi:hypothetical protein